MGDTDRFRKLDDLFQAVCELPTEQRQARLIELAPGDEQLRSEVLELLEADSRAETSDRLSAGAVRDELAQALALDHADPEELAGYRVLSRLGTGGMGVVYEAEQRSPRRSVALKVLRPGLATPDLIRRFEFEAQALARLRHPGIAQVFEAGVAETPSGLRPFFAMELVRGTTLDRWADGRTVREKLSMVASICDAVQHAHAQGVLHRDLKPANILVTREGQAKVLDFGVARAADADQRSDTLQTTDGQIVGTLPYMSPELVGGDPSEVDTRSDVYAIGVVLFELLSGRIPHEVSGKGLMEAARVIRDDEPTRLATLEPRLRGDIDTIVRTAIFKDKQRRYQTASAMGDDIRRYLDGQTIAARPASAAYQLSRLARRHKPAVAALAVAVVAVAGSIVGISLALGEAVTQRELARAQTAEAERQAGIARAVTDFVNNDILASVTSSAQGYDVTVHEALDAAAAGLEGRFEEEPVTGAAIRNNLGNVYHELGEFEKAIPLVLSAFAGFEAELGPAHELTQFAKQDIGAIYRDAGMYDEARVNLESVLADREASIGRDARATLENVAMLAELAQMSMDLPRANELLDEFESRRAGVLPDGDSIVLYADMVRGTVALEMRDYETALEAYERVAVGRESVYGERAGATLIAWHNVATAYEGLGRYDEAEPIYKRNLEIERERSGPDNPDTLVTAHNLAYLYESMGRYSEAEPLYLDTLERCRVVFGPVHPGTLTCTQSLASLYRETDRNDEAMALLQGAYDSACVQLGEDSPQAVEVGWNLSVMYAENDRAEEADRLFASLIPSARQMLPEGHPRLGSILSTWGETLLRLDRPGDAMQRLEEAYGILSDIGSGDAPADARLAASRLIRACEALDDEVGAARWRAVVQSEDGAPGS